MLAALFLNVASAKSFSFSSIEQDIYFQPNGSVRVVDTRSYDFNGSFSKAFLTVDTRGSVVFSGVEALDGKAFYGFSVDDNTVRWSYDAESEARTFRITYVLNNEVDVASDAAKFDRQVLEPVHQAVGRYVVRLHAPAGNPDLFKVFVFSRDSRLGTLEFDTATGVATINLEDVAEDEWVRTFVLLPAKQFLIPTLTGKQLTAWLEGLKVETKAFRNASSAALAQGGFAPPPPPPPAWLLALPLLGALFFGSNIWNAYQKYGREPSIPEVGKYYREPAQPIPPGVVPYVLSAMNPGSGALGMAISATLIDFTRRGFLELQRGKTSGFLGLGAKEEVQFALVKNPQAGELTTFEEEIWRITNRARGFDNVVTQTELQHYFTSNPSAVNALVTIPRDWYEQTHGALMDTADSGKTLPWTIAAFVAGVAGFAGGIFLLANNAEAIGIAVMVAGLITILGGILAGIALSRWHADKLLNAKRWLAYKHFLTDFSQMETAPAEHLKLWDYHFVFATALGVSQTYLKNIKTLAERYPQYYHAPYWLPSSYYHNNSTALNDLGAIGSLAGLASNLSSLESALSSSSGSGGGFGGGSSGGSSGGGGSSGAS